MSGRGRAVGSHAVAAETGENIKATGGRAVGTRIGGTVETRGEVGIGRGAGIRPRKSPEQVKNEKTKM